MTDNSAADLAAAIRKAAQTAQACVVEGFFEQAARAQSPQVTLDQDDSVLLITAARPRVVYLIEVAFDLNLEMEEATETLLELGVTKPPATLAAARQLAAAHGGEIRTTLAGFMVDGALHTTSASAEWHDAFEEVVDGVLDAAREDVETRGRAEAAATNTAVSAKAALLAAHPSFNFGRVSFEKRLTLAEALFKECDEQDLREVTRCAENLFWLEQSGFKAIS